jgi:putative ABC transport system permease protein
VAIFLQTAGVLLSNKDPILMWMNQTFDAQLFVTSGSIITGNGQNLQLEKDLGKLIQEQYPQVTAALPIRTRPVDFGENGENTVFLIALDAPGFSAAQGAHGPLPSHDHYARLSGPGQAKAIVSKNFAALYKVKERDVINLRGPHGPIGLQVAGIVEDYSNPRGTVFIDLGLYEHHFGDLLVDQFCIYLRPDSSAEELRQDMQQRWEADRGLLVWTSDQVREHLLTMVRKFSIVAYSQELIVGLVAALGMVFTLLISVLQRRRELGILRAIGATQGQILLSVMAEAILMGIIGTALGLLVGIGIEWYCVQIIIFEESGFFLPLLIPWQEIAWIACGAMLIATFAGLGPALRTMHLRIPEAIAYE